ncbi:MAG: class I SAM-dependent methyltransferase [Parvibaculum sp.]|nr:class I SAM-dependent methyltransferase [Parvibaculum sp.]|tara:strand:+ start:3309 stop:4361 length:1053 start_codon:yes stop_codon:yes gene_type:complete
MQVSDSIVERADVSLPDFLVQHSLSAEYRERIAELQPRKMMSPPAEVAMIAGIIEYLKPDLCLEIGTFFGKTALAMAEAVARNGKGKLITIDPFGADRVPDIMKGWPAEVRAAAEFRPDYSMQFFSTLEAKVVRGGITPLGVVFVDGNHAFEYALFDIMAAAANIVPGGAVITDNLEQEGPKLAVIEFLKMNPAWQFFYEGKIWQSSEITARDLRPAKGVGVIWGVLIAPNAVQVTAKGYKARGKTKTNTVFRGVRLNICFVSESMEVTLNFLSISRPHDFHIKGEGAVTQRRDFTFRLRAESGPIEIPFDPPVTLNVSRQDVNFTHQLEIALLQSGHVLLDAQEPYRLL